MYGLPPSTCTSFGNVTVAFWSLNVSQNQICTLRKVRPSFCISLSVRLDKGNGAKALTPPPSRVVRVRCIEVLSYDEPRARARKALVEGGMPLRRIPFRQAFSRLFPLDVTGGKRERDGEWSEVPATKKRTSEGQFQNLGATPPRGWVPFSRPVPSSPP